MIMLINFKLINKLNFLYLKKKLENYNTNISLITIYTCNVPFTHKFFNSILKFTLAMHLSVYHEYNFHVLHLKHNFKLFGAEFN
jgi:hypothetical protein